MRLAPPRRPVDASWRRYLDRERRFRDRDPMRWGKSALDTSFLGSGMAGTAPCSSKSPRCATLNLEGRPPAGIPDYYFRNERVSFFVGLDGDWPHPRPISINARFPEIACNPNQPSGDQNKQARKASDHKSFVLVYKNSERGRETAHSTNEWLAYGFMAFLMTPVIGLLVGTARACCVGIVGLQLDRLWQHNVRLEMTIRPQRLRTAQSRIRR
jgi:hypothetical protein